MSNPRRSKLQHFLQWRMKVVVSDNRYFVGTLLAHDKHMNIVLSDCEEFRKIKSKDGQDKELKRPLGLIILRGSNVISLTPDAPPLPKPKIPVFKAPQGQAQVAPKNASLSQPFGGAPVVAPPPPPPPGAALGMMPPMGPPGMMPPMPGMPGMPAMPGMPGMMPPMPGMMPPMPGMPMPFMPGMPPPPPPPQ